MASLTPSERRARKRAAAARYRAANREKIRAQHARWRAAHPESIAAYRAAAATPETRAAAAAWRDANREALRAAARAYHRTPGARALRKIWRDANREKIREQGRVSNIGWRERNREQIAALAVRRRGGGRIGVADLRELRAQPCAYCGESARSEVDHVIPVAAGGSSDRANLAPACRACNGSKGDRPVRSWYAAQHGAMPAALAALVEAAEAHNAGATEPAR